MVARRPRREGVPPPPFSQPHPTLLFCSWKCAAKFGRRASGFCVRGNSRKDAVGYLAGMGGRGFPSQ